MTISEKIKIVIVTGLSGAGKTQAMKALEDLDFFCIDNLPPSLLPQLIAIHQSTEETRPVAVAMDVRGKGHFAQLTSVITWLEESLVSYKVVFLECENDILVRRFSETRRRHPLADQGSIYDSIAHERKLLADVRQLAHLIIDTSAIKPAELKALLNSALLGSDGTDVLMQIDLLSFGFKYGVLMTPISF